MAVAVLLTTLAACSDDRNDAGDGDESRGDPADVGAEVIGTAESGCDLPVLVDVPEKWVIEAITPETVELVDDKGVTSPGGFVLVCALQGSRDGIFAPIFIFVAPPRVARDLTADQLLQRFVRATEGDVEIEVRDVAVGAGPGVEGAFAVTFGALDPVPRRAFVLPTPNGAVVVTHGGIDPEMVDQGIPAYESVRDSMRLPD